MVFRCPNIEVHFGNQNCPNNRTVCFLSAVTGLKDADDIANSVDPEQTVQKQSDLSLHCLLRAICPKDFYT